MRPVRAGIVWAATAAALWTVGGGAQQVLDLPGQDRPLATSLEDVFRVGSMDGADWETFGEIEGVAFDAQGHLYIFDGQSSRIVVTDPEGNFVREVGGPGEGPGEFRRAVTFAVFHDGSVVIADMGHQAYQIFGPDGEFQRMVRMPVQGGVVEMGDMAPDPHGNAVLMGGGRTMITMSRQGPGLEATAPPATRPIRRISLEGEEADGQVFAEGWRPPRPDAPAEISGGGMRFRMAMAAAREFEPGLYMGALPEGGVAFSDSAAYTVKVVSANGALERVLRRPFTPRPVTEAMQEAERKRRLDELEAGEGPRVQITTATPGGGTRTLGQDAVKQMMRSQVEQMQFYPELPVIMDLATGWGGKIWVVRRGDEPTEAGALDVLTPAGQYVGTFPAGTVALPGAFGPEGMVAYVERDEFDVPTVVVKRLPVVLR